MSNIEIIGFTLRLSAEERFELTQALEENIRQSQAAIEKYREYPAMNGPGGVKERSEHSNSIRSRILLKLK